MSDGHWLVAVDADAVQAYVYESARLPEIAGASALLSRAGEEMRTAAEGHGVDVCYEAGGTLLGVVESSSKPSDLIGELTNIVTTMTVGAASATGVSVECDNDPRSHPEEFRRRREEAARELKTEKFRKTTAVFTNGSGARCASCDSRLASAGSGVCEACRAKSGWQGHYPYPAGTTIAYELGDLHPSSDMMGMILLDGDGMGAVFEDLDWGQSKSLSTALENAMNGAVSAALEGVQAARIIYVGGDDLLLFVPGPSALSIAHRISEEFAQRMTAAGHALTLSGGALIAKSHYPVPFLHQMVKQLCQNAKQHRRATHDKEHGWLDFQVLRSASLAASDLRQLRQEMGDVCGDAVFQLHDRPYRMEDIRVLRAQARALHSAGKGALVRILGALREGPLPGSTFMLYSAARGSDAFQEALFALFPPAQGAAPPGWAERVHPGASHPVWTSRIADAIDLWDLTEG